MKRLVLFLALLPSLTYGQVARIETTKGQYVLSKMFKPSGQVGWPGYAAAPVACAAAVEGAMYYDTALDKVYVCNGTAWTLLGVTSPIAGDFVATGKWTWGTAAEALGSVRVGEDAGCLTFEGGTADAIETTFCVTDPTIGSQKYSLPNRAAAVAEDTLATLGADNAFTGANTIASDTALGFGTLATLGGIGSITALTPDAPVLRTGTTSNSLHLFENGDAAYDFSNGPCGAVACTTPTLIGHSGNQSTAQWWGLTHNASNTVATSGTGQWSFPGNVSGATGNEIIGAGAGAAIASGGLNNTLLGSGAATSLSTGDYNVCVGWGTCGTMSTTSNNTAVGYIAGAPGGTNNTQLGYDAGAASALSGTLALGSTATPTASNQAAVCSASVPCTDVYFNGAANTDPSGDPVVLNGAAASGTDIVGGNITIAGGKGTGTGTPGNITFSASKQLTTGATAQTLGTRAMVVGKTLALTDEVAANLLAVTVPNDSMCAATIQYHAWYQDADEIGGASGQVQILAYEEPGAAATYACQATEDVADNDLASDAGTFTLTFSCATGATTYLTVTENQEANDVAATIIYNVTLSSGCVLTPQ